MTALDTYFEHFLRERTYLNNITPKTREGYQTPWKASSGISGRPRRGPPTHR